MWQLQLLPSPGSEDTFRIDAPEWLICAAAPRSSGSWPPANNRSASWRRETLAALRNRPSSGVTRTLPSLGAAAVPSRVAGWPVQSGLFWRCAPGCPDLLCPDGAAGERTPACPPRFAGWPDDRHDRDVRPLHVRAPDPAGRPAAGPTLTVQERVPWKGPRDGPGGTDGGWARLSGSRW